MTQDNKIQTALEMIESYDWFWRMSDAWLYDSAKAGMRRFVTFVNTIGDENMRNALRGLWVLRYEEASSIISGRTRRQAASSADAMPMCRLNAMSIWPSLQHNQTD